MKKETIGTVTFREVMAQVEEATVDTRVIQHFVIVCGEKIPWDVAIDPVKREAYLKEEIAKEEQVVRKLLIEKKKQDRTRDFWASVTIVSFLVIISKIIGLW